MYHAQIDTPTALATDSHVRDARLWMWVEKQDILTIEDIVATPGTTTITFMLQPSARKLAEFLAAFAEHFGE